MATFILIAGGWQGGWVYQQVAEILAAHGHTALPITLSGLGDTPAPMANLETHIGEVVSAVKSQQGDVVLVGQSYGGMVVSGAADAAPSQIRALVYVDAYVPGFRQLGLVADDAAFSRHVRRGREGRTD